MMINDHLKQKFEQAELLTINEEEFKLKVENWELQGLSSQNLTKSSLRVIDEGRIGSNTTFGSLEDSSDQLIKGASESVRFGGEASFAFAGPGTGSYQLKSNKNYDEATPEDFFSFLQECLTAVREREEEMTFNLGLEKTRRLIQLETSEGCQRKEYQVLFSLLFSTPIPGGGSELLRMLYAPEFFKELPEREIEELIRDYRASKEVSVPETGKMPVLFMPRCLYFLPLSLAEGISGKNLYRDTSPLKDRLGEKLFSDRITITDCPQMAGSPRARYFDDEGIPTSEQTIVEAGSLQQYIYDLEYATRMGAEPTGHGMKQSLFFSDIDTPVTPSLINPVIQPGEDSREDILSSLKEGIIVESIVGFHSSNYTQGHFSVQAHGFHVQQGEIAGRLQDVMIAGNIYQDFKNVQAVGERLEPTFYGFAPCLLVDGISVTGR